MHISRRKFLIMACTLPALPLLSHRVQAAFPILSEHSREAKVLHYKGDISRVKHPKYQKGQVCANCQLFNFLDNGCVLFSSNSVAPEGWCQAWVKKV